MPYESFKKQMQKFFKIEPKAYPNNIVGKTYLFEIKSIHIREVAKLLNKEGFVFFHSLVPVDYSPEGKGLQLNYFFENPQEKIWVVIRTEIPIENPEIDSIHDIFPAIEPCEREEWEKFGINFKGHPRLKPLLLDETLQGKWVLRKSYVPPVHKK
jgi:NADH-quinone oxidoreductase subunit C